MLVLVTLLGNYIIPDSSRIMPGGNKKLYKTICLTIVIKCLYSTFPYGVFSFYI